MLLIPSDRPSRVHFSAIGGTGMAAGARLALEAGWEVRGSDNPLYPPASAMVAALGAPVATEFKAENLDWAPDVVVVGNVLTRGNPEVEAILDRKLHYVSLPEWLKDVVLRLRRPVVVAGTHGKTTTTALTAHVMETCGLAPGYLIGGQPLNLPHSSRLGREGGLFVIEGDEYDSAFFDKRGKFFHYLPETVLITSVEFDHGDIYPDLAAIQQAFRFMLRQTPPSGHTVLCADDPGAMALRDAAYGTAHTYGFDAEADWRGEMTPCDGGMDLTVCYKRSKELSAAVPLSGIHNGRNAVAAAALARIHGASAEGVAEALRTFRGVRRRMEVFHEACGITFVDDFAHHPTAIGGVIRAARERWPGRRLWALFEPRSNTTVTNRFQDTLTDALSEADCAWAGPLYRGAALPEATRLDRARLARALEERGLRAGFADDVDALVDALARETAPGDVVLILSNGAFGGIYAKVREAFSHAVEPSRESR